MLSSYSSRYADRLRCGRNRECYHFAIYSYLITVPLRDISKALHMHENEKLRVAQLHCAVGGDIHA